MSIPPATGSTTRYAAVRLSVQDNGKDTPMSEEQMRVLRMIEEGKISAEDGAKLLSVLSAAALRGNGPGRPMPPPPPTPPMPPTPPPFGMSARDRERFERDQERAARDRERAERDRER